MARAATTSDVFNAVAEPRRRAILELVAQRERSVGEIATATGLAQPSVSKHLKVLHDVALVRARREGKSVLYHARGESLRPLQDWTEHFEQLWQRQLVRIKEIAEAAETEKKENRS